MTLEKTNKVLLSGLRARELVLLSLQRALVGSITSNIRAVLCQVENAKATVKVIFANTPSEHDLERMSIVETEMCADLPVQWSVGVITEVSGTPKISPGSGEEFAFLRHEPV